MTKEYSDFLAHYGIKGQKHGVRRFQNEDGTLTPEGQDRYAKYSKLGHKTVNRMKMYDAILDNRDDPRVKRLYAPRHIQRIEKARDRLKERADKMVSPEHQEEQRRNAKRAWGIIGAAAAVGLGVLASTALRNKVRNSEMERFKKAVGRMAVDDRFTNEHLMKFSAAGARRIAGINRRQAFGIAAKSASERAGDFFRRRFRR